MLVHCWIIRIHCSQHYVDLLDDFHENFNKNNEEVMSKFQQNLNIANFICRFGDGKVLLDLAKEIVIPAFLEDLERNYGDNKYFLIDKSLVNIGDSEKTEVALTGRFVKKGKIGREQVYEEGKIVKDPQVMDTAPTSFFVLLLSNHKLLYVRETPGAPSIQTFATTIESFIKVKRNDWINSEFERLKETKNKVTKKSLYVEYPPPEVNVVELSSEVTIREFVKKFKVLNSVEVRLVDTNHELDNSALFGDLRNVKNSLGSDSLSIKNEKKGLIGLKKERVAKLISGPAEEGNSRINLKGIDSDGDKLSGNNEEFKLSIPITLPARVKAAASKMVEIYKKHIESGILSVKDANHTAMEKLLKLKTELGL